MTECGRSRRIGSMRSADLIREARLRAGLTQYELAERSGRDRSVIARWEQGSVAPSIETLVELLRACGFDLPPGLAPADPDARPPNAKRPAFARDLSRQAVLAFQTDAGELKIVPEPAGTRGGYDDLRRAATREPIGRGLRPRVASIGDLARMLAALGRERDLPPLQQLRTLAELERSLIRGIER